MRIINLHITFSLNNIFIIILNNINANIVWSQSLGKLGFKNKTKQLKEAFSLLLVKTTGYLVLNNLQINQISLNHLIKKQVKAIKTQFTNWSINAIVINRNISHNGCRVKKNTRKKGSGLKVKNIKL